MIHGNYIDGEWRASNEAFLNVNPSNTEDVIGEYSFGSAAEVDDAVKAARQAAKPWANCLPQQRHDILKAVSEEILLWKDELGRELSREEGKVLVEGVGEVVRAAHIFAFFAGECLRLSGDIVPSLRAGAVAEMAREPVGIVGVITPWNFPMAIPAWKIAPALAYGNCVVFKPAELVPGSAHRLVSILEGAGLPKGVVNLVMGTGAKAGRALIEHQGVDAISFTGSVATGRMVAEACVASSRMKKVQLEMGGKNPLVVLDDADLQTAVECAVNGAFHSTGQRCTASSRIVVTRGIHDRFIAAMVERLEALRVGDALDSESQIGPVVSQDQLDIDLRYIEVAKREGAELFWGGRLLERRTHGYYLEPALFINTTNDMRVSREEIFGPVANVICVSGYDEALHVANDTEFGLSSGICTTSLKYASHFKRNSEAGMVMINLPTAGVDYHVPFGGRKKSSYGPREQGGYSKEFYTSVKTTYVAS